MVYVPVLRSGWRHTHRSITAVYALHLRQCSLLIVFVRKPNKSIASGLPGLLVCHDLRRLARWESSLEESDEDEFVHFVTQIANEDGIFRAAIIATIDKSSTRGPVKAKHAIGVWDRRSVKLESLLGPVRTGELDKTISGVTT